MNPGIIRKHAPEHRNVRRAVTVQQNVCRLGLYSFAGQSSVGESERGLPFLGRDKGELLDEFGVVVFLAFELAKQSGDHSRSPRGRFRRHPAFFEMLAQVLAEPLGPAGQMITELFFEHGGGAPRALQALRGNPQTSDAAEYGALWPPGVVAV